MGVGHRERGGASVRIGEGVFTIPFPLASLNLAAKWGRVSGSLVPPPWSSEVVVWVRSWSPNLLLTWQGGNSPISEEEKGTKGE